jgi:glycosyltransferase involved in cell wall biosynthesis
MRAFDLLVVNSRSEPFGLTVIEAMASGTPVVATAVDGIPEIIRHGESGWLIKGGDHSSLVDGMLTLLLDPDLRRKFCQLGRQAAIERFSQHRFLNETQSLYRTLRSGRKLSHTVEPNGFKPELTVD